MTNYVMLITDDVPVEAHCAQLCAAHNVTPDEPFCFSVNCARLTSDAHTRKLQINICENNDANRVSVSDIARMLNKPAEESTRVYINAPLDVWLREFEPMLCSLVATISPSYGSLNYTDDEFKSLLYLCVIRLYNGGYYLHKRIVQRAFVNALNLECRRLKYDNITESLDAPLGYDEHGEAYTRMDVLADTSDEEQRQTERDAELFARIKAAMLTEISEMEFNRILLQLMSHTMDQRTVYILDKYRRMFAPHNIPRPNARTKTNNTNK